MLFANTYLEQNGIRVDEHGHIQFGTLRFKTRLSPYGYTPVTSYMAWLGPLARHVNRKLVIANRVQLLGHRTSYNAAVLIAEMVS